MLSFDIYLFCREMCHLNGSECERCCSIKNKHHSYNAFHQSMDFLYVCHYDSFAYLCLLPTQIRHFTTVACSSEKLTVTRGWEDNGFHPRGGLRVLMSVWVVFLDVCCSVLLCALLRDALPFDLMV